MSVEVIPAPYPQFNDSDGEELENGYVYIGEENKDPKSNPITVYWDSELTEPASQPLRTDSGYISRTGTPSRVFVSGPYSITVKDKKKVVVYTSLSDNNYSNLNPSVKPADTVDDMVSDLTLAIGNMVETKEHADGTGGGNKYEIVAGGTGTADDGSFIDLDNGLQARALWYNDKIDIRQFGAVGDGLVDDTSSIVNAVAYRKANGGSIFYPAGTYLITNFHRECGFVHYGEDAFWKIDSTTVPIPNKANESTGDLIVYVDASAGSDEENCGLSADTAYKTIQYAWDSTPDILKDLSTIQLADGTYDTSSIDASDQPRPSILWGFGKTTTRRSTSTGDEIESCMTIRGNSTTPGNVILKCGVDYTYGVYINKGNIGVTHLRIEGDGVNATNALMVAHRTDTYIHTLNVELDGIDKTKTTYGAYAESSGQLEMKDTPVSNCSNGIASLVDGDNVVYSVTSGGGGITDCTTGALALYGGMIYILMQDGTAGKLSVISGCTTGALAVSSLIRFRGSSPTVGPFIESPIDLQTGSDMECVYTDIDALVTAELSNIKFDEVNYQDQVIIRTGNLWLDGSVSYISPATANNENIPVALLGDSSLYRQGTNTINGASGVTVPSRNPLDLDFTADSQTVSITDGVFAYRADGSGANRLTCEIDSAGVPDGTVITVDGNTWGVEFTAAGTHMEFGSNLTIGNSSGHYTGATFMMRDSKWRLVGLGQARP